MRKKYIILLLILLLIYSFAEASNDILAIQSTDNVEPYQDALEGFESVCNRKVKKIFSSKSDESTIIKEIRKRKPAILLAIGMDALSKIKKIKDIPIIYLMILNPQSILSGEENIIGISMYIPPEKQLEIFQKALPGIKKIGLLFDPNNSGFFVKRAQDEAKKRGLELIIKEVGSSKKVPSLLIGMKEEIDAIWMLPDMSVFSQDQEKIEWEVIEFLFKIAFESKIPVFTFSKRFIGKGALISLSFDEFDLGKQGGELAKEILSGKRIRNLSGVEARKVTISIDSKMAKKLGITISDEILNRAE